VAAGSYTATLFFTNLLDQSVQPRQASLAVVTLPLITSQPTNQAVLEGMTATFSVGTASSALQYYQWQFDSGGGLTNLTDGGGISGALAKAVDGAFDPARAVLDGGELVVAAAEVNADAVAVEVPAEGHGGLARGGHSRRVHDLDGELVLVHTAQREYAEFQTAR